MKLGSFVLVGAGLAGVVGALSLIGALMIREGDPFCAAGWHLCSRTRPYMQIVPFAALVRAGVFVRRRPWRQRRPRGYFDEVAEGFADAALGSVVLVLVTFFFRSGLRFRGFSYSRVVFVLDWLIATAAIVVLAVVVKAGLGWLRRRGHNIWGLVVVGNGTGGESVERHVLEHPEMGYSIVAKLRGEDDLDDRSLRDRLTEVARNQRVDEVVLAVPRIDRTELSQIVSVAELGHLQVSTVPELFGLPPTKTSLEARGHLPVLSLLREPLPGSRRIVKRTVDVVGGGLMLLALSPILLVCSLLVRLSSRGPVLHRQQRVGMDGRPFAILKFRSMRDAADTSLHEAFVAAHIRPAEPRPVGDGTPGGPEGPRPVGDGTPGGPVGPEEAPARPEGLFKLEGDQRVTSVGRFLRRFSLDELPQLINVIRGEMSLVGPRPALPFEVALYEEWHRRRLEVRPGMTGLWQVGGRAKLSFDAMVRLDITYIEEWSLFRDFLVLLRTIPAVFRKETG
jgi:exopolysaccharide biosynthesis polyprenyl glycosylphosphotransferase